MLLKSEVVFLIPEFVGCFGILYGSGQTSKSIVMGGSLVLPCVDNLYIKKTKVHAGVIDDTLVASPFYQRGQHATNSSQFIRCPVARHRNIIIGGRPHILKVSRDQAKW